MNGYDDILDVYLAHIERPGSWNNLYERPGLKALLPPARVEYVEKHPTLEDVFLALVGHDGPRTTKEPR